MPVRVFCMMPAKIHLLASLVTTRERLKDLSLVPGFFLLSNMSFWHYDGKPGERG